ncbi:MAG: efflux RND transporter permease subunit [Pseudomonadota bacterium]
MNQATEITASESRLDSWIENIIHYRRLVFSLVFLFIAVGLMALSSMARQEDPLFPYRAGLIKVFYPGGTPLQIEKLITEPMEEELAQVAEVDDVISTSRDDLGIFSIELRDYVYDTDAAWDRVRNAVDRARLQFPAGVSRIEFDDRQIDMPVAVLSITGSNDPILLEDAAEKLKKRILSLGGISRIEIEGAAEKELVIKLDQDTINQLGMSRQAIAQIIAQRNQIIPGGLVSSQDRNIRLNTQSDFSSVEEIKRTIIQLPSGQTVSLESIADISIEPRLPLAAQAFQDGKRAVSLGVITQRGQLDVIAFGQDLRQRIAEVEAEFAPLKIEESFFQPDYVQDRLSGLQGNLLMSVFIIAAIVFFALGWRTGAMVSAMLPIVSIISLGLYSAGGGVFHQMAVIGMVISLGILIDNAIVVVEYIEAAMQKGLELGEAARSAIKVMAKPLFASTGTTIAAFIPLLLAEGGVGDFTRAIPTMIVIALIVSYILSIFVLPLLAMFVLKGRQAAETSNLSFSHVIADRCATLVETRPRQVLLIVALLLGMAAALAPFLKQEFFPSTDRAQIVVDLELPNNTPLAVTSKISEDIEARLQTHEAVDKLYRYVGGAGFRFYYNTGGAPNESHIARFTINTRKASDNQRLVDWVRSELKPAYPDVVLIPRLLGQGPPRPAPIEIRVKHPELATLHTASQTVKQVLLNIEGVSELRSNLDVGTPELQLSIQDQASLAFGLQPNQVASAVFSESRGLRAGQFRYDNDPIPIIVRSSAGQRSQIEVVENQSVYGTDRNGTPLHQLAAMQPSWQPTALRHHNFSRTVTVLAQIGEGFAYNQILADFDKAMKQTDIAPGVEISIGGDAEASSQANSNIATAAPLALGLLIFFMMYQFNSFRRIGFVFLTIPLAAVGVIPGLAFTGQPFGFQSLLGVIALVGIVVNNAIVLIDVMDHALAEGDDIKVAVRKALENRTAPILLTTATTILGLLPLALSASTLWPPMAWAIISGLLLSSMLTLIAIPALCILFLGKRNARGERFSLAPVANVVVVAIMVGGLTFWPGTTEASSGETVAVDMIKIVELSRNNLASVSARELAEAANYDYVGTRRNAYAPKVSLGGELSYREDTSVIGLPQPFGELTVADKDTYVYELKLTQPLFDPANQKHTVKAAKYARDGAAQRSIGTQQRVIAQNLSLYLSILATQAQRQSLLALEQSLQARVERIRKNLQQGRALKTDELQVQVALNQLSQQLLENQNRISTDKVALVQALNLPADVELQLLEPGGLTFTDQSAFSGAAENSCYQREDCLAAESRVEQLQQQSKAIRASTLPSINLSLAKRRSDGQLFVAERDRRALLEFSWPIFTGGEAKNKSRAVKAQKFSAERDAERFKQRVKLEIEQALAQQSNAESALKLAASSVELDTERTRLSRQRYEGGLLNIDELLDAEASLAESQANLKVAELAIIQANVALQNARGVDFKKPL